MVNVDLTVFMMDTNAWKNLKFFDFDVANEFIINASFYLPKLVGKLGGGFVYKNIMAWTGKQLKKTKTA